MSATSDQQELTAPTAAVLEDKMMTSKQTKPKSRAVNLSTVALIAATLVYLILALIISPEPALAQGMVRAWGMGGANTAISRGLEAVSYNPANLAFSRGTNIGLAAVALDAHNNSLSLDRYNEITGTHLDEAGKTALMADIPEDGFRLDADARASALGVQSGNYAFSFSAFGAGQGNLDKDYFDLVLFGNELGFQRAISPGSVRGAC